MASLCGTFSRKSTKDAFARTFVFRLSSVSSCTPVFLARQLLGSVRLQCCWGMPFRPFCLLEWADGGQRLVQERHTARSSTVCSSIRVFCPSPHVSQVDVPQTPVRDLIQPLRLLYFYDLWIPCVGDSGRLRSTSKSSRLVFLGLFYIQPAASILVCNSFGAYKLIRTGGPPLDFRHSVLAVSSTRVPHTKDSQ